MFIKSLKVLRSIKIAEECHKKCNYRRIGNETNLRRQILLGELRTVAWNEEENLELLCEMCSLWQHIY